MGDVVIELDRLTKVFDKVKAVDNVSFKIRKGEIFGLLGPNGAGKTTTIRMLTGLARPSSGTARILGLDIISDSVGVRKVVGVVPQSNVLDRELSVYQNLAYHAKLHGMKKSQYDPSISKVLKLVGMTEKRDSNPLILSGGMKRRLTIAKALVHDPEVLFLDEPTTGLDPQSKRALWKRIQALSKQGITMILTTHYMEEAERLCDKIGIIDKGKVIALDTPSGLKSILKGDAVIEITHTGSLNADEIRELKFVKGLDSGKDTMHIYTEKKKEAVTYLLTNFGDMVLSIDFHEPTLEDVFLHLTGSDLGG